MADGKVVISTGLDNSGIKKDAGQLTSIVKGTLGGLAKVTAGITTSIVAAFGAAAVAITKQAADAYADYEQLLGGVETLFKDSANKVAEYAEDAFYTVGISANEYMETVTSFSASLISALGGDTAKAADIADMALTDMADNANKMGTALEGIKNAYQAFAKQNYTMLDNLKLGYGGTKTEMERLLADAQKLTGIKYNIDNLADVYNAIHAIQVEMGIAGTTAKEAEKTITGSANMTKAAWKNVLAAIAGGGDLDKAINNLVYSVSRYFDNIVPVVERSLSGIGELIERIAPQLVETVAAALIKAIPSLLNAVYEMIIGLANGIYEGIVALFSGSTKEISAQLNAADDLADSYNSAADGASNLADATTAAGKAAKKYLAPFDEITKLSGSDSGAASSGSANTGSIGGSVTVGGDVTDELTPKVEGAFQTVAEKFRELAEKLAVAYAPSFKAWSDAFAEIAPAAKDAADRVGEAFGDLWENDLAPLADYVMWDWAPSIENAWSETIAPIFAEAMPVLLEDAAADFEYFCLVSSRALDDLEYSMEGVKTAFKDMCASFSKNWNKYGGSVLSGFTEFKEGLRDTFDSLYWEIIEPIISSASDMFDELWTEHLAPLWDNLSEAFLSISDSLLSIWNTVIKPFIDWLVAVFAPIVTTVADIIIEAFGGVVGWISDIIGNILDILSGLLEFVAGVFSGDWKKAWDGIVKAFSGVWEGLVNIVKGVVNAIIWGINSLVDLIWSTISAEVNAIGNATGAIGELIGQDWSFSMPSSDALHIPYLAKGAVLPPNKPFMAVVGDQTHGTNVEAPLATIQEAVAIVMEDVIRSNIAGHEATVAVLREILEAVLGIHIGDDVIGEAVARYNAKMAVIRGGV